MRRPLLAALALLTLAAAPPSLPLVPADQVKRATDLLYLSALSKIKNANVAPTWLPDQDVFWYPRDTADGVEFTLVDAATGRKSVAFDHAALARALSESAGRPIDAKRLPVSGIAGTPAALTVTAAGFACTIAPAPSCRKAETPDPSLLIAPDGRQALLVKDHNLWLRDLASGAERALTSDGAADVGLGLTPDQNLFQIAALRSGRKPPPFLASWSPDSTHILVPRIDQRAVAPYPYVENVPQDGSFRPKLYSIRQSLPGEPGLKVDWFAIDVVSGARKAIDLPASVRSDRTMYRIWWGKDPRQAWALAQDDDMAALRVFAIDAVTGATRQVLADPAMQGRVYDLGGAGPAPARLLGGGRELLWMSAKDGWDHLYLHDAATGRLKNRVTGGRFNVREVLQVDEATRTIVFSASEREPGNPYHRYLYRVKFDGSGLRRLTTETGDHATARVPAGNRVLDGLAMSAAISPSGRFLVYGASTVATPPTFAIRRIADGGLVADFEQADASALLAAGYRPPEEVVTKAADGKTDIWGVVYRPSNFDPAKKYAVIDAQYGSPLIAITPRNFLFAAISQIGQATSAGTAELGFIVVTLDARGTPNRSRAFSQPAPDYLQKMGLDDHVAFIRQLAARDRAVDLDRVAINGISFGGWTAIRGMIEYPEFYKVGFAGAAPGSFVNMWSAPALTISQGAARYAGKPLRPTPTAIPDTWQVADSTRQVDRLKGKLLMAQGEQDENVLPASALQFYDAAMKADKDVDLIWVPNGTHGGIYSRYALRRTWDFFLANLNGTTLPPGTTVASPLGTP